MDGSVLLDETTHTTTAGWFVIPGPNNVFVLAHHYTLVDTTDAVTTLVR